MNLKSLWILVLACVATTLSAQKKPLDQSAYDGWKSIVSPKVSENGDWICYAITPQRGEDVYKRQDRCYGVRRA